MQITPSAVATHALAYMMQGITQHLNYPLAIHGTKSATSGQMYNTFWECVEACEPAGFRVRTFICDDVPYHAQEPTQWQFEIAVNLQLCYTELICDILILF